MKSFIIGAAIAAALSIPQAMTASQTRVNPFFEPYGTTYDIPPFDRIQYSDYLPAFKEGIARQKAEVEAIAADKATPTFENTILAMEKSGDLLNLSLIHI